jgi:two-component system alkaline phosphatase synthesis response regulator PhoP
MSKPFKFKELLLRVKNILRRHYAKPDVKIEIIKIGQAVFDLKALTVETPYTKDIISEKESLMLRLLYNHRNQVVSREKILDTVWGTQNYPSARTIDNFIVTLRKWIERNPSDPAFIISHRGVGYSLQLKDHS